MALTSAVMETQFDESFKARLAAEDDAAIKALRERAFAAFTEKGFPSLKDEDWKYTNVSPIAKESGRQRRPASNSNTRTPAFVPMSFSSDLGMTATGSRH